MLERLRAGAEVALVTDAGLPGISDPGTRLVAAVLAEGLPLSVLPGPSAPATALVASGLSDEAGFRFVGYLPRRPKELRAAVAGWRRCGGVVVAFETPQRLVRSLAELAALLPDAAGRRLPRAHQGARRGRARPPSASWPRASPRPRSVRRDHPGPRPRRRRRAGGGARRRRRRRRPSRQGPQPPRRGGGAGHLPRPRPTGRPGSPCARSSIAEVLGRRPSRRSRSRW